jgi:hypothetical protein
MPKRIVGVPLALEFYEALALLASAEHRRVQDEAAALIGEALARSGFLETVRPPKARRRELVAR